MHVSQPAAAASVPLLQQDAVVEDHLPDFVQAMNCGGLVAYCVPEQGEELLQQGSADPCCAALVTLVPSGPQLPAAGQAVTAKLEVAHYWHSMHQC